MKIRLLARGILPCALYFFTPMAHGMVLHRFADLYYLFFISFLFYCPGRQEIDSILVFLICLGIEVFDRFSFIFY